MALETFLSSYTGVMLQRVIKTETASQSSFSTGAASVAAVTVLYTIQINVLLLFTVRT